MKFLNDPNLARRDMWFTRAEDAASFLAALCREHESLDPGLVSAALMQARKNMSATLQRGDLKQEVDRILRLPVSWELTTLCA